MSDEGKATELNNKALLLAHEAVIYSIVEYVTKGASANERADFLQLLSTNVDGILATVGNSEIRPYAVDQLHRVMSGVRDALKIAPLARQ